MSRKLNGWGLAVLMLALAVNLGCGAETAEEDNQATAQQEEAWAAVEAQKAELDAKRAELAQARAAGDAEPAEGEEAAEPAVDVDQLEAEVAEEAEALYTAVVDFLNNSGMVEGEPPTERQQAALDMKVEEDMLLAQEYIDRGGNYPKAISIYQDSLQFAPDNAELQAALARAEEMRYQDEVRNAIGQPNLSNIKKFPEDNVEAWFYAVDANGSAAAVWFRERNGQMMSYKLNFAEVVRDGPTVVGGEEPAEDAA